MNLIPCKEMAIGAIPTGEQLLTIKTRIMKKCMLFKQEFLGIDRVSVHVSEDGLFEGTVYIDRMEFIEIIEESGNYMVFINNPYCEVDEYGCPIFTDEHPNQQWVFGYYKSLKRAINRAKSIVMNRKYPKPIEIL